MDNSSGKAVNVRIFAPPGAIGRRHPLTNAVNMDKLSLYFNFII